MSKFILQKVRDGRFMLLDFNKETPVGLMIGSSAHDAAFPTAYAFSREYGTVYLRDRCANIDDFPELAEVEYFAIEYCRPEELKALLPESK